MLSRQTIPPSLVLLLLLLTTTTVFADDPPYAIDTSYGYRVVSLPWFDYFNSIRKQSVDAPNNDPSPPAVHVYVRLISLPTSISRQSNTLERLSTTDSRVAIHRLIEQVFTYYVVQVLAVSARLTIHPEQTDPTGVLLPGGWLNRTIVVSFEDPPYGQSSTNRLVTDRRIAWVLWANTDTEQLRFRHDYRQTHDLAYRFLHNLAHVLGFGHYVGQLSSHAHRYQYRSIMYPTLEHTSRTATRPLPAETLAMRRLLYARDAWLRNAAIREATNLSAALSRLVWFAGRVRDHHPPL